MGWSVVKPRLVIASAFSALAFSVAPIAANAQSQADSVAILLQAAHAVVNEIAPESTVYLDPRPEYQVRHLTVLAFEALQDAGFEYFREPGIPVSGVALLSPGGIREGDDGLETYATIWSFTRSEGMLNNASWSVRYRVDCDEGSCDLGSSLTVAHSDGWINPECWDDYFARSLEGRGACFGFPPVVKRPTPPIKDSTAAREEFTPPMKEILRMPAPETSLDSVTIAHPLGQTPWLGGRCAEISPSPSDPAAALVSMVWAGRFGQERRVTVRLDEEGNLLGYTDARGSLASGPPFRNPGGSIAPGTLIVISLDRDWAWIANRFESGEAERFTVGAQEALESESLGNPSEIIEGVFTRCPGGRVVNDP